MNLFCEHSELYWATLPTSGTMRNGQLFPRQLSEPPTNATGFSSLPTPNATDWKGSGATAGRQRADRQQPYTFGDMDLPEVVSMLGTPRAANGMKDSMDTLRAKRLGGAKNRGVLEEDISLLPTPSGGIFNDGENPDSWEARRQQNLAKGINGNGQGTPLTIAVQQLGSASTAEDPTPLLPTPNTMDSLPPRSQETVKARNRGNGDHGGSPRNLRETAVNELLPTPQAHDRLGAPGAAARSKGGFQSSLPATFVSYGEPTSLPSAGGSLCSVDPLPGQLSLLDETELAGSPLSSSNGSWGSRKGGSRKYPA